MVYQLAQLGLGEDARQTPEHLTRHGLPAVDG